MKNLFKFLGVIALVAVIGFGMVACGGGGGSSGGSVGGDATIVVKNEYLYTITGINGITYRDSIFDLDIKQGKSQTFKLDIDWGGSVGHSVSIYTEDPNYFYNNMLHVTADTYPSMVMFGTNKTTTITLTAEGKITFTAPQ